MAPSAVRDLRQLPATLCLLWGLLASSAWAGPQVGVGLDVFKDLPDGGQTAEDVHFGAGPALRLLIRQPVGERTAIRGTLAGGVAVGNDRVEWSEYGGAVRYYSDQHWTLLSASKLVLGPDITLIQRPDHQVRWGAQLGLAWVQNWHSFHIDDPALLDPALNDLQSSMNVDPYSSQVVPTGEVHLGMALLELAPFAIEVEAGYSVAFLPSADLHKTPSEVDAVRTAFGLNALSVGVAATMPFGGEAD